MDTTNEENEVRDLIRERDELHFKVLFSTQKGDVEEYLNVFSDNVPRIIEIEKRLHEKKIDGFDVRRIAKTIKVSAPQEAKTELEKFEHELRTALRLDGKNPNPDRRNTERAEGILKKKDPAAAASKQQKLTENAEKLFRRGKALLEMGHPDLCKGFWVKLASQYTIDLPPQWGGSGSDSEDESGEESVVEVREASDFTDEEKVRVFDQILALGTDILRRVLEDGDDPSNFHADVFRYVMPLLGPATSVLGLEQTPTKLSMSEIKVSGD